MASFSQRKPFSIFSPSFCANRLPFGHKIEMTGLFDGRLPHNSVPLFSIIRVQPKVALVQLPLGQRSTKHHFQESKPSWFMCRGLYVVSRTRLRSCRLLLSHLLHLKYLARERSLSRHTPVRCRRIVPITQQARRGLRMETPRRPVESVFLDTP